MEQNKIGLAKKSRGHFVNMIICLCLNIIASLLIIFVLRVSNDGVVKKEFHQYVLFLVISIVLFPILICSVVKMKLRPQFVIEYDEAGIYLNYRIDQIVYIAYNDIEEVRTLRGWNRTFTRNSFGKIIVVTKDNRYSIGIIDEVEMVKNLYVIK